MIDWRQWLQEPLLVSGVVLLGGFWAVLAGPLRPRMLATAGHPPDTPFPRGAACAFYAALLFVYLAVGTPLNEAAERYLLTAHMIQHQLLIYPAAMLFLIGLPAWMTDPFLQTPVVAPAARLLTRPLISGLVFVLVFGIWHAPWLYDAALQHRAVHVVQHLLLFGAGVLCWWPLLSRSRRLPRSGYGTQMLYLLGVTIGLMPLHAYIILSRDVLYRTYDQAPRLFAEFSASDDQLLAGVLMQSVAVLVTFGAFAVAFYRWYQAAERK